MAQRHFTLDPGQADERSWVVPLRLRVRQPNGDGHELRLLLDQTRRTLTVAATEVVTLTAAPPASTATRWAPRSSRPSRAAGPGTATPRSARPHRRRLAATLAGSLDSPAFLDLVLTGFTGERDLTVWQAIAGALGHLAGFWTATPHSASASSSPRPATPPRPRSGSTRRPRGARTTAPGSLRATLVRLRGATADRPATIEACRQRLDHPDPTLAAAALAVVAAHGDAADFARIRRRFENASDPQTESAPPRRPSRLSRRRIRALHPGGHPQRLGAHPGRPLPDPPAPSPTVAADPMRGTSWLNTGTVSSRSSRPTTRWPGCWRG